MQKFVDLLWGKVSKVKKSPIGNEVHVTVSELGDHSIARDAPHFENASVVQIASNDVLTQTLVDSETVLAKSG
ncbi:hypothetical protein V6N13_028434 [Hibiscus sabdariffa]